MFRMPTPLSDLDIINQWLILINGSWFCYLVLELWEGAEDKGEGGEEDHPQAGPREYLQHKHTVM